MTKAADFLLSREVCLVQPSKEVLYVLLYAHLDHLHSILECEFDIRRPEQTLGHLNSPPNLQDCSQPITPLRGRFLIERGIRRVRPSNHLFARGIACR